MEIGGERALESVYLSLGSNLGDREGNLHRAVRQLDGFMLVSATSSLYETAPVGPADQPSFLNIALCGTTRLQPVALLRRIKAVERDVGRRPTYRWGPRVIDIDILLYGERLVREPHLTIPHIELTARAFVLLPLAEIAPDTTVPGTDAIVAELAARVADAAGVWLVGAFNPSG